MSFVETVAIAIDGARTLARLDDLSRSIWKGLAAGALGDEDAQSLAERLHAVRTALKGPHTPASAFVRPLSLFPPRRLQRAPQRAQAIERRRRLAASGPLPPSLACRFTTGEQAVLRIVGDECRDRGACLLSLGAIAARAGVCRKLAQTTVRLAVRLGLLKAEERRRAGQPNLTNVVTVVAKEWLSWLKRGPRRAGGDASQGASRRAGARGGERGGGKKGAPTDTQVAWRASERAERPGHNPHGRRGQTGPAGAKPMP
jgi:hypothetical protein